MAMSVAWVKGQRGSRSCPVALSCLAPAAPPGMSSLILTAPPFYLYPDFPLSTLSRPPVPSTPVLLVVLPAGQLIRFQLLEFSSFFFFLGWDGGTVQFSTET